mgnify:CR=1 FL=1
MQRTNTTAAVLFLCVMFVAATSSLAVPVDPDNIHTGMDAAPNVYSNVGYDGWWRSAKKDVAGGTFQNMQNGDYPGTNWISGYDCTVYSTNPDASSGQRDNYPAYGKRLHFVATYEGISLDDLHNPNNGDPQDGEYELQSNFTYDWAGQDYSYDWKSLYADGDNNPDSYDLDGDGNADGVAATVGFAWWATDNYAEPLDTDGNKYNETDGADVDALAQLIERNQTYVNGQFRIRQWNAGNSWTEWQTTEIDANVTPEPATMGLMGLGLVGLVAVGYTRRRRS